MCFFVRVKHSFAAVIAEAGFIELHRIILTAQKLNKF
jgi:hypothetical protein